jgi:ABC-2 type transport system permease protein
MSASLRLFVRVMAARAYPRIVVLRRQPSWIVIEALLAVLSVSAFALVYRTMAAPKEYVGFVILGGVMTAFWLNVLWSMGAQLYWDRDAGNLELYIAAPAPLPAILAGMALGGIAITLVRAAVILLAGALLFDVSFEPSSWWALLGIFLATLLALYGLGMVFASGFLLWGRQAFHIISLLQEPVYLLSGLSFPVKILGRAVPYLAVLLPLTTGIDAMRQVLFPQTASQGLMPVWIEVTVLVVLSTVFLGLAWYGLRVMERRARTEGRLTTRLQ